MDASTILIFEPLSGGHRANFIQWLSEAEPEGSGCRFVFFTADDAGDLQLETAGWWQKQKRLYDLFRKACEKHHPDHVLILELTHLELPLILFGSPVPLSAILFVQYPNYPASGKIKGCRLSLFPMAGKKFPNIGKPGCCCPVRRCETFFCSMVQTAVTF
jgi:hypothetical protein